MFSRVGRLRHAFKIGVRLSSDSSFESVRAKKAEQGRKKLIYIGAPLILFLIGGSVLLSEFLGTHMELKDKQNKSTTERNFDLEEEHKTLMKKLNIDDFSLSRIPRPPAAEDNASPTTGNKTENTQQKAGKS